MSMEEEQARQAAAAGASASSSMEPPASARLSHELQRAPATAQAAQTIETQVAVPDTGTAAMDEEEAMLQQALAMSEGRDVEMREHSAVGEDEMTEEEAIARAIEMSMKGEDGHQQGKSG